MYFSSNLITRCIFNVKLMKVTGYLWKEACGVLCCGFMETPCISGVQHESYNFISVFVSNLRNVANSKLSDSHRLNIFCVC